MGAPALWGLVLLGYFLGSIPFGYLLVRARSGRDIRYMGSGNIGATNVARTSGWSTGIATLFLDAAKGFLAVWLIGRFSDGNIRFMVFAGLAAMIGHVFPAWLRFAGGKGVATALGVFLGISWQAVAVAVAVFLLVAFFWRYISLASISAAAALPLLVYLLYAPGHAPPAAVSFCTLLACILVIIKHRDNIERLMAGTEPRFEMGRKKS
ncbi:MAG TPA: glycerol-3-phosphate 1-O-acyltransferase PlsY [Candidatus Dormibacteraeota bacterium]|nr:glycerol-3-phosphate 1-O-acyltransferase PlsY [Candidatus Dormibacteraeota bacterium]